MPPYLRPTLTQRVRAFLDAYDPIEPWSTWTDALDRLHALLIARRDDSGFWADLQALADDLQNDIQRGRCEGLPAPEAELLSEAHVASVLTELRDALDGTRAACPGSMQLMLAGRSAALAACVTVIAAALTIGCGRTESAAAPDSAIITADPAIAPADAGTPDALVELFRDASADVIAAKLEAMLEAGVDAAPEAASGAVPPKPTAKPNPPRPPRPPINAVPRYKGVTF